MTTLRRAIALLTPAERRQWAALVPLALVAALAEAAGAAAVYLLIRVIGDPARAAGWPVVGTLATAIGERGALLVLAGALTAFHLGRNAFQAWVTWVQSARVAAGRAALAGRLLAVYLAAPWATHVRRNPAELMRNVALSVDAVVRSVLAPAVALAAEVLVVVGIATVLLAVSPGVTLALVALLGGTAAVLLRTTRARVQRWGREAHDRERDVLERTQQTLAALKEIRVLGRERWFWQRFAGAQEGLVRARHRHAVLTSLPRVLVEAVFAIGAFGLVALIVLLGSGGDRIIPLLGLYAYAGFRIIPSANRIMMYVNEIRAAGAPVAAVHADLAGPRAADAAPPAPEPPLALHDTIALDGVSFRWHDGAGPALADVDLVVRRGEAVAIVGTTGSGKSTLVDVLIGLLPPDAGRVLVDGQDVAPRRRAWQQAIGYVPQAIVLVDDSLRRNVALGVPDEEVDPAALAEALRLAQLDAFVATLPAGLETRVGERGVRLSGGERQRVGIARALYHKPEVLVFDEATSALDNRTEADLMSALAALRGTRTLVVVAHRLSSVRACDRLVVLARGRVVAVGGYEELRRESDEFRRLVAAEPAA